MNKNNKSKIISMKWLILLVVPLMLVSYVYADNYYKSTNTTFMFSLQNAFGEPVKGNCTGYVFYPNMTLYRQLNMTYCDTAGVYYAYFEVPNVTGVYLEVAKCNVSVGNKTFTVIGRKTFRVTDALNEFQNDIHSYVQNSTMNVTVNVTGNLTAGLSDVPFETWKFFKMMEVAGITLDDPQVCLNSTHLLIYTTRHVCIGGKCFDINSTDVQKCEYGCDNVTNSCNPPPYKQNIYIIALIGILGAIIVIMYLIARR